MEENIEISALEMIPRDIEICLQAGLWYPALVLSLSIPGVCTSLEMENGWSGHKQYKDWCERYLTNKIPVPAELLYQARCGVVHQARGGFVKSFEFSTSTAKTDSPRGSGREPPKIERVLFVAMNGSFVMHCNQTGNALQLDTGTFCRQLLECLNQWKTDMRDDETVQGNMASLLTFRSKGIAPLDGLPTIS